MITDTQHGYGGRRLEGQIGLRIASSLYNAKKTKQYRNKTRLTITTGQDMDNAQKVFKKRTINRNSKLFFA